MDISRDSSRVSGTVRTITLYIVAARSAVWLCALPLLIRMYSLPLLLQRAAGGKNWKLGTRTPALDRSVWALARLCQLRFFRLPVFPRDCMRQSMVLYWALNRMGYPVAIHFGIRKQTSEFNGHSWVTLDGKALGERISINGFVPVYSYPAPGQTTTVCNEY